MNESLGFNLKGESAPFTAAGKSGMAVSQVSYDNNSAELNHVGHRGLVVTWQTAPAKASALLPTPLEADQDTARVCLVVTECQSARSPQFLFEEHPEVVGWFEASLLIPCSYEGLQGVFCWVRYVDVDHCVLLGLYQGLPTKRATFAATFPFVGQPQNRDMTVGNVAAATASRFDAELFSASFECTGELQTGRMSGYFDRLHRQFGVRYMPDWMTPGGAPLVDDLIMWEFDRWTVHRGWTGTAHARVSGAEDEELALIEPERVDESYYVEFDYLDGPGMCRSLCDYRRDGGERASAAGTALRGASPPFTPSGMAALGRSTDLGGDEGDELGQAGHVGIYLNWRVDPEKVAQLIPWPLEVTDDSERVWLFMNQTQSGINRHNREGSQTRGWLAELRPHHVNWHEAMFRIPCAYKGELGYLLYVQYKDRDHSIYLGAYDGFTTKLADFRLTFPMTGQPFNREMAPGATARIVLSRLNERIMTAEFTAVRELPENEIERGDINILGMRHFPDYTARGKQPLVHDIVNWHMVKRSYSRAWVGDASITFGESRYEELYLLEPIEMLPSLFVYLEYQGGPGTAGVVHDYRTGEQAPRLTDAEGGQLVMPHYQR
jgi:acetoacetate decarboxylase